MKPRDSPVPLNGTEATEFMGPEATEFMGPEATEFVGPKATELTGPEATDLKGPAATDKRVLSSLRLCKEHPPARNMSPRNSHVPVSLDGRSRAVGSASNSDHLAAHFG